MILRQTALRSARRGVAAASMPAGSAGLWNLAEFLGLPQKGPAEVEVVAIDPRTVLQPDLLQSAPLESCAASIRVPRELLPKLSKGDSELADMDEPGNAWYFGERSEIFDYRLVGEIPTKSGYAAFIPRDALEALRRGDPQQLRRLLRWEDFLQLVSDEVVWPHRKTPFLFA
ncbi:hypothetical protein Agub_g14121, partial [Astrephomene gubernaculifera]